MTMDGDNRDRALEVLIADNDWDTCLLIKDSLGGDSFAVCTICTTVQQVECLRRESRFDLCVLDVRFADGVDQLSRLLAIVASRWPNAIVCVLSNYLGDIDGYDKERVNVLVQKPLFLLDPSMFRSKLIEGALASDVSTSPPWQRFIRVLTSLDKSDGTAERFHMSEAKTRIAFDVFLSHNSKDKPTVRTLGEALKRRGLRVWLDEWELVPGHPWQEALEDIIKTTGAAAVLVGPDGFGPWEIPEMRGCLSEFVRRRLPVIPVLLPGAAVRPELPLFLSQFTWVDLRDGLTHDGLDQLEWGITGRNPKKAGS